MQILRRIHMTFKVVGFKSELTKYAVLCIFLNSTYRRKFRQFPTSFWWRTARIVTTSASMR
jgi:hypothetical protein